jgi:hypothetical protein
MKSHPKTKHPRGSKQQRPTANENTPTPDFTVSHPVLSPEGDIDTKRTSAHTILQLQAMIGNQATQRLMRSPQTQAPISVSNAFAQSRSFHINPIQRMFAAPEADAGFTTNKLQLPDQSPYDRQATNIRQSLELYEGLIKGSTLQSLPPPRRKTALRILEDVQKKLLTLQDEVQANQHLDAPEYQPLDAECLRIERLVQIEIDALQNPEYEQKEKKREQARTLFNQKKEVFQRVIEDVNNQKTEKEAVADDFFAELKDLRQLELLLSLDKHHFYRGFFREIRLLNESITNFVKTHFSDDLRAQGVLKTFEENMPVYIRARALAYTYETQLPIESKPHYPQWLKERLPNSNVAYLGELINQMAANAMSVDEAVANYRKHLLMEQQDDPLANVKMLDKAEAIVSQSQYIPDQYRETIKGSLHGKVEFLTEQDFTAKHLAVDQLLNPAAFSKNPDLFHMLSMIKIDYVNAFTYKGVIYLRKGNAIAYGTPIHEMVHDTVHATDLMKTTLGHHLNEAATEEIKMLICQENQLESTATYVAERKLLEAVLTSTGIQKDRFLKAYFTDDVVKIAEEIKSHFGEGALVALKEVTVHKATEAWKAIIATQRV